MLDDDFILCGDSFFRLPRGQPLCRDAPSVLLAVAGVDEAQGVVLDEARARVAAVLVVHVARPERKLRQAVMHEILGFHMPPALVLVLDAQGIPLKEDVVLSRVPRKPVGIVDEAERHFEMEVVVPTMLQGKSLAHLRVDRFLVKRLVERFVCHDLTPSDRRACTSGRKRCQSR